MKTNIINNLITIATNLINVIQNMKLFSYTGAKTKYKKYFHHILAKIGVKKVGTHIEAFAGSLASLWHIMEVVNADKIVINDINPRMINLYIQIQKNPNKVYSLFEMLENKFQSMILPETSKKGFVKKELRGLFDNNRNFYNNVRKDFNNHKLDEINAAEMLFLLNHNFNGLYGENKKGGYNIAFNWRAAELNMNVIKTNIFNLSNFLNNNNVVFECLDIDDLIKKYNDFDTLIYLDPIYVDSIVQYNKKRKKENSFNKIETHLKIIDSCKKYKYVIFSNNFKEEFISPFDSYITFERTNTIASKKTNKPKTEILAYKVNEEIASLKVEVATKIVGKPANNTYKIKVGSGFSGLGAPEYALKKLNINHSCEFVIDINKYCRQTLIKNYNPKQVFSDITKVDAKKLLDVDLYVFGSPCNQISLCNNERLGLKGKDSKLFFDGYRILKENNFKYFIFENVANLKSSNNGEDFKTVLEYFKKLNYSITYKIINAVEVGGNTTRKRLFIVGIRNDIKIEYNFPKYEKSNKCIKDFLITDIEHKYLDMKDFIPWHLPLVEQTRGILRKDYRYTAVSRQEDQRVFNINYPCPTIKRNGNILIFDGIGIRKLLPLELKAIQGLENDLDFGNLSDTQIKSQLGNTMEITTMKHLIAEIVRIDKLFISMNINANNLNYSQPTDTTLPA